MILGYYLQGQDNDSFLSADLHEKNISDCIDFVKNRENYLNKEFKIKRTKYEFSYTYDGALIVSARFKNKCERIGLNGIDFYQLENHQDLFLLKVKNIVEFDSERRNTRFLEFNESCGEYNEIIGAVPVCLKTCAILETGLYRTDIEFGRGYAKGPLILIDSETYKLFEKAKFTGLYGEKVFDKYNWEE